MNELKNFTWRDFENPEDILDLNIPKSEKIKILENWKNEYEQLSKATDEGMNLPFNENSMRVVRDINLTLDRI